MAAADPGYSAGRSAASALQDAEQAYADRVAQHDLDRRAGDPSYDGTFTAELRPAARRRRFQRSESTPPPAAPMRMAAGPAGAQAAPRQRAIAEPAGLAAPDAPGAYEPRWNDREPSADGIEGLRRLIDRQHAMLVELSKLSDRVIEASDRATREELRANAAEAELASAQQRLLAARGLVGEAQKVARLASERAAFVEGRADALQATLDEALSGTWFTRRRLRREYRGG